MARHLRLEYPGAVCQVTARGNDIHLCREAGGMWLRDIGQVLGIKGSAMSLAAKRVRERMAVNTALRNRIEIAKNNLVKLSKT